MKFNFFITLIGFTFLFINNSSPDTKKVQIKADKIIVEKADRTMYLCASGKIIKTYKIALGANPEGHKTQLGDEKTPEGIYYIDYRNPNSKFHKSLHISYPNKDDINHAKKLGVSPGGDIMIHGISKYFSWLGPLHRLWDWTDGCIAVTNSEMDEIWDLVPIGIVIEIKA